MVSVEVSAAGLRLGLARPVAAPAEPLPVMVVGRDADSRARLVRALAGTPGVRVVGWAEAAESLPDLGSCSPLLVVLPEEGRDPAVSPSRGRVAGCAPIAGLSPRQRDVLAAYATGNELLAVVARRLAMGPETMKTHLRRIRSKYEAAGRPAPTRRDLYVRAVEDGILPPPC